ncbi:PAP2 superfamily-domain-containing protein [Bombardia bombarda]|uniref:PAP2 superfamily-domain-containing protein n=1 Tax=Bombardia bombarda TaxID=252184 RepID=A0AA39X6U4_9PEZI|nr:PAP2 superfamily-domain-containing protein [Bombardia bombarda]
MAIGAVMEPLVVASLLAGGTLVNRNGQHASTPRRRGSYHQLEWEASPSDFDLEARRLRQEEKEDSTRTSRSSSDSTIVFDDDDDVAPSRWHQREIGFFGWKRQVTTPNNEIHRDRFLSRVLRQFPFLAECWYWALIYWVYQLGRAFTAVTLQESTVDTAREHALQVIHLEQYLGVFYELDVQALFIQDHDLMRWINRIYSFIHIPGSILFLIILFYVTTTQPQRLQANHGDLASQKHWKAPVSQFGPDLFEKRRRTMAMCNLLAFIVFTFWPCMPPRLLSDPTYMGEHAEEAKSFGFVDTVHGKDGDSSVWTTNKFCNQFAAMPSLHFGYSFLIGLTVATIPLRKRGRIGWKRFAAIFVGMLYPALILTAIISTANHFILDAVAGAIVCAIAWRFNRALLNLLPLEDYFLNLVRIHKP